MNTAVKKDTRIPIINVVAKPQIEQVPKLNRMIPVMMDVRFKSKIAENAFGDNHKQVLSSHLYRHEVLLLYVRR